MTGLRALSVRQPWAWAIADAGKTVENRTRLTNYRGPVAIHASLELDEPGFFPRNDACREAARALDKLGGRSNFWDARWGYIGGGFRHPGMALGAIIAVAEIEGCHSADTTCGPDGMGLCSPWAAWRQWHWVLGNVQPLAEPVPARGMLGLWTVPEDIESSVRAQLEVSR